tara:strand:- start:458 stop:895 length:438 start_codon:yes stop_codon:yes gene_type:complete
LNNPPYKHGSGDHYNVLKVAEEMLHIDSYDDCHILYVVSSREVFIHEPLATERTVRIRTIDVDDQGKGTYDIPFFTVNLEEGRTLWRDQIKAGGIHLKRLQPLAQAVQIMSEMDYDGYEPLDDPSYTPNRLGIDAYATAMETDLV